MQIFFLNGLWRFLKNEHLPVKLHSSAPPGLNLLLRTEKGVHPNNLGKEQIAGNLLTYISGI